MFIRLVQDYGIEPEVANHLANSYGDRAFAVAKLAEFTGKRWPVVGNRLHTEFPYIEAEVRFCMSRICVYCTRCASKTYANRIFACRSCVRDIAESC